MIPGQSLGPLVAVGQAPVLVGRMQEAGLCLDDASVSRRHATVRRDGKKFVIEDLDSRFGTFVNGHRIRIHGALDGDRIQFGTSAIYRAEADGLRWDGQGRGLQLMLQNLCLGKEDRLLVDDASCTIAADSFVGVLGPSGIGKSTLLNCMAGFLRPWSGTLLFDDQRDAWHERDEYRAMLGYVPQDDVVHVSLTIGENVAYAAELRFGLVAEQEMVDRSVHEALACVDLTDHATKTKYSGGQRKRLSVAIELLRRPRLLLLDEPTSSLDPSAEADLMAHLRLVAQRGTTVVCTTHKVDHFRLFDQVIVFWAAPLPGSKEGQHVGRIAYAGRPDKLLAYFAVNSFAELYERLKQGGPTSEPCAVSQPCWQAQSIDGAALVDKSRTVNATSATSVAIGSKDAVIPEQAALEVWFQLGVLLRRSLVVLWRNKGQVCTMLAQPIVLGVLVCLTQFRNFAEISVIFFAVVIAIWLGMNNSIRDLVHERGLFILEQLAGLSPGAYLASKLAVYGVAGVPQLLVLLIVLRTGCLTCLSEDTSQELFVRSWIWLFFVLFLTYLGGVAIGLLVSAWSRSEQAAIAALPLLIMPQLLLSGVATGLANKGYGETRAFRPVVAAATSAHSYERSTEAVVDLLSMACLSRPATLLIEAPHVKGFSDWELLGDFCHLVILVLAAWCAACVTFFHVWETWPKQLGFA